MAGVRGCSRSAASRSPLLAVQVALIIALTRRKAAAPVPRARAPRAASARKPSRMNQAAMPSATTPPITSAIHPRFTTTPLVNTKTSPLSTRRA